MFGVSTTLMLIRQPGYLGRYLPKLNMHSIVPFAEIKDQLGPDVELQQFDLGDYDEIL